MRRFILHSLDNPERRYECVLWSNGCVAINIAPESYRTHFHSLEAFQSTFDDDTIEWIDTEEEEEERDQRSHEANLQEMAALYLRQCAAYDRQICTAYSKRTGESLPANMTELHFINHNARTIFDDIVQQFHVSPKELHHAIRSYEPINRVRDTSVYAE